MRDQRTCPDLPAVDVASDAAARFEPFFQPRQIVDHLDDAASGQAEIDAALEVVPCRIAEVRGELAFAPRIPLMYTGPRLPQFAPRLIGSLHMNAHPTVDVCWEGPAGLCVPRRR